MALPRTQFLLYILRSMKKNPGIEVRHLVLAASLVGACNPQNQSEVDPLRSRAKSNISDILSAHPLQQAAERFVQSRLAGPDIQLKGSEVISSESSDLPFCIQRVRLGHPLIPQGIFQDSDVFAAVRVTVVFQEKSDDPPANTIFTVLLDSQSTVLAMAGEE